MSMHEFIDETIDWMIHKNSHSEYILTDKTTGDTVRILNDIEEIEQVQELLERLHDLESFEYETYIQSEEGKQAFKDDNL